MADYVQESIAWAQRHGVPTPGFEPNGMTTLEATAREIVAAEQAFMALFGKLAQARGQGLLLRKDFERYERAREQLYQAQLQFYRDITTGRVYQALNALGMVGTIPVPQRAPAATVLLGTMPLNGLGRGLGNPVAAPLAGVGWGAIIIGIIAVGATIAITAVALGSAFEAKINAFQHSVDLEARLGVMAACLEAGEGDHADCAAVAAAVVPPIPPPPGSEDPMWVIRLKKTAIYSGVALGVLAVGYLGVKLVAKRIDERPALRGLPSGAFSGARFPVKPSSRPSLRGARGRTSLAGRHSSHRGKKGRGLRGREYNMEVMP